MTYAKLLEDLKAAERITDDLEAAVDTAVLKVIAIFGGTADANDIADIIETEKMDTAYFFILDRVRASEEDTDDAGRQNAVDTVADYGVEFDSLVGKFIYADTNHKDEG